MDQGERTATATTTTTVQSPDQLSGSGSGSNVTNSPRGQPVRRPSSPNASSVPITQASSANTHGTLNQHPNAGTEKTAARDDAPPEYRVGVSEDRNKKCRRTMEDAHAFVYDFGGVKVSTGYYCYRAE